MTGGETQQAIAIVLIITAPGKEQIVFEALDELSSVSEKYLLFGEYDIFAKLVCGDYGELSKTVVSKIRSIQGVEATKTLTAAP